MSEDDLVTIADNLDPHVANGIHRRLASAEIKAVVRDATSISDEPTDPVSAVLVRVQDEATARQVLATPRGIGSTEASSHSCAQCGRDTDPGMQRCLVCVEKAAAANVSVAKRPFPIGLILGGLIAAVLLYMSTAGTLD